MSDIPGAPKEQDSIVKNSKDKNKIKKGVVKSASGENTVKKRK